MGRKIGKKWAKIGKKGAKKGVFDCFLRVFKVFGQMPTFFSYLFKKNIYYNNIAFKSGFLTTRYFWQKKHNSRLL